MNESGINAIMKIVLRFLMTLIGGIAGYQIAQVLFSLRLDWMKELAYPNIWTAFSIVLIAMIGFVVTPIIWWALRKTGQFLENMLQNVSVSDIGVATLGLIVSLLLANLVAIPFIGIPGIGFYVAVALNIFFAFVGMWAFLKRRDDIWVLLVNTVVRGGRLSSSRRDKRKSPADLLAEGASDFPLGHVEAGKKVLDTSSLIDGRILDIANTGFLEGILILPRFVLTELQGVADSSDPARRARGRKGLNVVSELQQISSMVVNIVDTSMKDLKRDKVDEALVELCKKMGAKILTTDYNLNQIARIEGVSVLNVNDLANSLKPQFLPGEQVKIDIIRPGKEQGQGIGYLEDGTMLVVEDGESDIGQTSEIIITSMLQTSAGRMVFGKIKR
ncbi:MAG: TRAM domain-containing protein [Synergistaceae bacterium]|nr:TRAM domain-containing protein [Synergistaceae bacterium]